LSKNGNSLKWQYIENLSKEHELLVLCDIARVSLSGYYAFQKRKREKRTKEDREMEDMKRIEFLVLKYKRKHGYRSITMDIARV
jgi:hypothetical protein